MAKTSFQGPVRSKENFKLNSVATSTGIDSDRTQGPGVKDARRFYLEEYFHQRPALNATLDSGGTTTTAAELTIFAVANKNFETLGTSMTTALTTFASTSAGILMTTAGSDQDQSILLPHLDTNQSVWSGTKWGTENQVEWECSIMLPAIDNQWVWAGLKKSNVAELATDTEQAFFTFGTDADNSGQSFDDFTKWHFVHSIGGTDYISQIPITVAANTPYHLRIKFDSDRKVEMFLNGVQYDITTTSGSTGGTAVAAGTAKSAAITNDINLTPYIGIEACAGAAEVLNVHYTAISRHAYE